MEQLALRVDLTVAELLSERPEAIPVFLKNRMACVGCTMAPFETLADASRIYGIELDSFMAEIAEAIRPADTTDNKPQCVDPR